jgi:hypothetical protein
VDYGGISINGQAVCCTSCPNSYHEDAAVAQNYGCLPSYWEVQELLKQGELWMCHSNPDVVCSAVAVKDRCLEDQHI